MDKDKWFDSPPPSVGWWPASTSGAADYFRWYDGEFWSVGCGADSTKEQAAACAANRSVYSKVVKWKHRPSNWPKHSKT